MRILLLLATLVAATFMAPASAQSASQALSAGDKAKLAGEWRAAREGSNSPCGLTAQLSDLSLTLEFALTGGHLAFDDGTEDAGARAIKSVTRNQDTLAFTLDDGSQWTFTDKGNKQLNSLSAPDLWSSASGLVFHQCRQPADRSAIKLNKLETAAIAADMPPANIIFVDARAKGGCKALDFQYLFFDLVGPMGFKAGRWNSTHLAESLAEGKKPSLPMDEITNWSIDKAEAIANGYRLTLTELIPPNGSRGDTSTITLAPTIDGRATIPEWKRTYVRCQSADLVHP